MKIISSAREMYQIADNLHRDGKSTGFVPTMGSLHQGHLSLVRHSKNIADFSVVSIFVNPTQFNDPLDLEKYPRNPESDLKFLAAEGVDLVFCPEVSEIYPQGADTTVNIESLSGIHEGEFRPGHFRGVSTVVNILFNIVRPNYAFFGEKDFQQLGIVRRMVRDLKIPLEIIGCPIVREEDGLAMSSRNIRLSAQARAQAPQIFKALKACVSLFTQGEKKASELISHFTELMAKSDDCKIEYIRAVDPDTFEQRENVQVGDRLITAVWLDGVRLIDNVALS